MFDTKKVPILKIVLIAWLAFATLYVLYGEYNRLNLYVAQSAYSAGYQDSVAQLLNEVAKCQPVPITFGNQKVEVIGVSCLQQSGAPADPSDPSVAPQDLPTPDQPQG